ncbi:fibroblast growth factor receptor 3-like isoform X2 [Mercenaria mercenaria]|uniref:fibroblast growth factor receptor 3-like isoform X2 n=1 Tax=Mercenaria mercenaria TaxID=6596 RepID=UPI00234ECC0D|nr:fibroblast growth factor receptor 3-like isoform X2 [Mercenaria mercenaria]
MMLKMEVGLTRILLFVGALTITVIVASAGSPPKFKKSPIHDVIGHTNGSHKFQCKVRGVPKPLIVWYRGNEMLSRHKKRITLGKYSMRINNLQKSDSGKYACKASNQYGVIWGNFSLQVVGNGEPPKFKERLNQVKFLARAATSSVDLDCDVFAHPEAKISWWKNGKKMKALSGKYIFDGYKLKVKSLALEDNGNYTCTVWNEYGSVNWTTKVEVQQRITIAPIMEDVKNQTAMIGDNVTFTCQIVMSDSQPLLQWLRHYKENDSFVNEGGEPYVQILQSSRFTSTVDEPQLLVLRNVTKEDQGWYTCLAANTVGMNYRSAWLTVKEGCEVNNGDCHTNATCDQGEGMSNCKCKPGYTGDGHACTIKEGCEVNNGDCHTNATCDQGEGMSNCKCKPGYTGDGHTCTNIDECSGAFYPCLRDYTCEDRDPGYFCAPIMP